MISQSFADEYTLKQCYELKTAMPDVQTSFLFYMMIKLIRSEGHIDETLLARYRTRVDKHSELFPIEKQLLTHGYLTIDQITRSAKDFFLHDVSERRVRMSIALSFDLVLQRGFAQESAGGIPIRDPRTPAQ